AEYSPVRYDLQDRDPAQAKYFREPVPSKFNVGLRWRPVRWAEIGVSYQRGHEVGVGISTTFDAGKPFVPIYDAPWREAPADRARPLEDRIAAGLAASGFSDIGVASDDFTLRVEAQNDRYFFAPRAVEEVVSVLARTGTGRAEYVRVVLKDNGIPLAEFVTTAAAIADLAAGTTSLSRLFEVGAFRTDGTGPAVADTVRRKRFAYGVKPSVDTFLNDPARFFSYRAGATGSLEAFTWRGARIVAGVEAYPLNNVSTLNAPLSIPVRSDIALYKKEGAALSRLFFEQVGKGERSVLGKLSAGYLETMYAGLDAEAAVPLWDGRIFLGAAGSYVRKRAPDSPFRLLHAEYHTMFLAARLNIVEWNVQADVKAGRFLAGDRGASLMLSKFVNGFVLSAWYTATDTSVFSDPFNRGYRDKGILLTIPLRMFIGRDSKTVYRYRLSAWTRDAGQDIDRERPLFDLIGRNTPLHLDRDWRALYLRD
ncbi:MAG: YjbH domain-containing protein, partial [Gemmatimonadota bacterium]